MVATNLIKVESIQQDLLRQLYPIDANGVHQIAYGITSDGFNNGNLAAGLGTPPSVIPFGRDEANFIAWIFRELEKVINIKATQINSLESPLQIVSVEKIRDPKTSANTTGITYKSIPYTTSPSGQRTVTRLSSKVTIEAEVNDNPGLTLSEKKILTHEIGHSLGLDHSQFDPNDPAFNDKETLMSYRTKGRKPSIWFSRDDRTALQEIWGAPALTAKPPVVTRQMLSVDRITGHSTDNAQSNVDELEQPSGSASARMTEGVTPSGSRHRSKLHQKALCTSATHHNGRELAREFHLSSVNTSMMFGEQSPAGFFFCTATQLACTELPLI